MRVPPAHAGVQATYLSASDVVAALTALLEQPLSVRDDATPRDRFWCVFTVAQLRWKSQGSAAQIVVRSLVAREPADVVLHCNASA